MKTKEFDLTISVSDTLTVYVHCFIGEMIFIADHPFDWHDEINDDTIEAYDLIDTAAYYRHYAEKYPDRKCVVKLLDKMFKLLGCKLYKPEF